MVDNTKVSGMSMAGKDWYAYDLPVRGELQVVDAPRTIVGSCCFILTNARVKGLVNFVDLPVFPDAPRTILQVGVDRHHVHTV